MKKQLRNTFKNLKYIAPDATQKNMFRVHLQETMNAYPMLAEPAKSSIFRLSYLSAHQSALAVILIVLILINSTGVTFASQSALPGEVLYPVKLATEKVRIGITINPTEKAKLHLAFASRRLQELQEITNVDTIPNTTIETAFINYKTQLEESHTLLNQNPEVTNSIAVLIDNATTENRKSIKSLSEKTRNKSFAASFRTYLEDADEHAESKNEEANLTLLNASSTQDSFATTTDSFIKENRYKEKSHNKIESVKTRIREIEDAKIHSEKQESVNPEAIQKIEQAKYDIEDAENKLEQGLFIDSFKTSVRARQNMQDAKHIIEYERERNEKLRESKNENGRYEIKSIKREDDDD